MAPKKFELHNVPRDDFNEGWIWVRDGGLEDQLEGYRRIVKVRYIGEDGLPKGKHRYCEALYASGLDIKRFNEHFDPKIEEKKIINKQYRLIFISSWYRRLLDILKGRIGKEINVEITISHSLLGHCRACFQHPQVVVRLATMLAFIGAGLGIIGIGLGLIGIREWGTLGCALGWLLVGVGIVINVVGIRPLFRRARGTLV